VGNSGAILFYNGVSLEPMSSGSSNDLYDIWGTDSGDSFAAGESGTILHDKVQTGIHGLRDVKDLYTFGKVAKMFSQWEIGTIWPTMLRLESHDQRPRST
jgi:hypothetical protein